MAKFCVLSLAEIFLTEILLFSTRMGGENPIWKTYFGIDVFCY